MAVQALEEGVTVSCETVPVSGHGSRRANEQPSTHRRPDQDPPNPWTSWHLCTATTTPRPSPTSCRQAAKPRAPAPEPPRLRRRGSAPSPWPDRSGAWALLSFFLQTVDPDARRKPWGGQRHRGIYGYRGKVYAGRGLGMEFALPHFSLSSSSTSPRRRVRASASERRVRGCACCDRHLEALLTTGMDMLRRMTLRL